MIKRTVSKLYKIHAVEKQHLETFAKFLSTNIYYFGDGEIVSNLSLDPKKYHEYQKNDPILDDFYLKNFCRDYYGRHPGCMAFVTEDDWSPDLKGSGNSEPDMLAVGTCVKSYGPPKLKDFHDVYVMGNVTRQLHIDLGHFDLANNPDMSPKLLSDDKILYFHIAGIKRELIGQNKAHPFFKLMVNHMLDMFSKENTIHDRPVRLCTAMCTRQSSWGLFKKLKILNEADYDTYVGANGEKIFHKFKNDNAISAKLLYCDFPKKYETDCV